MHESAIEVFGHKAYLATELPDEEILQMAMLIEAVAIIHHQQAP